MKLRVEGMSCGHCEKTVREAIVAAVPGVTVTVDLQAGTVTVAGTEDREAVVRAIRDAGYEVREESVGDRSPA